MAEIRIVVEKDDDPRAPTMIRRALGVEAEDIGAVANPGRGAGNASDGIRVSSVIVLLVCG